MASGPSVTFTMAKIDPFQNPEELRSIAVRLKPSINYPRGTVVAEVAATPGLYGPYNDAAVDGLQIARGILRYDVQTDASGNVTFSPTAGQSGGEQGEKFIGVDIAIAGTFRTTELVGLDAAGVADLGKLIQGTVADGILRMG